MANTELGQRLKSLRQAAGLTQQQAAEALQLRNKSTLASWEGGKAEPDIFTFLRLCSIYGVTEADILTKRLGVDGSAAWDFSPVTAEDALEQKGAATSPDFVYCPFCGKRLQPLQGVATVDKAKDKPPQP